MIEVLVGAVFVAAYVLMATERIHRVAAALFGAAAMVLLGVVDARVAFFSEKTGVDWNVIFPLLGMMVMSVPEQTGVFHYVAIWAAKRTRGRPFATRSCWSSSPPSRRRCWTMTSWSTLPPSLSC